ncbi:hypothetical protein B6V61_26270 [Escherichia coli]|nr:hypothetical protein [Escherichia coli]
MENWFSRLLTFTRIIYCAYEWYAVFYALEECGSRNCANTSRLQGYVAGALISTNASNNPSYGKTAFISFAVLRRK